jgi:hypothetical protein
MGAMTTWLDFRSEPMTDVPEISEWIQGGDWTITCQSADCKFTDYGERTENWMEEMHESIERHQQWHEDGMPE